MQTSWDLLTFFVAVHPCHLISTKGNDFSVLVLNWIYKRREALQLGAKRNLNYKIMLSLMTQHFQSRVLFCKRFLFCNIAVCADASLQQAGRPEWIARQGNSLISVTWQKLGLQNLMELHWMYSEFLTLYFCNISPQLSLALGFNLGFNQILQVISEISQDFGAVLSSEQAELNHLIFFKPPFDGLKKIVVATSRFCMIQLPFLTLSRPQLHSQEENSA